MSEQINRVLADRPQSFTTAEQKQARDNIGAAASGDYAYNSAVSSKQDQSAMSSYVPYSAISADANSAITSINGSSVGLGFSGVSANNGISGDGMPNNPIGLSSSVIFQTSTSATKVSPASVITQSHLFTSVVGPGYVNNESVLDRNTATLSQSALRFFDSAGGTATCDASSINRWNSYSAATKVVSRSYPYTDTVEYSGLTIYDPYQTYGASIQDPSSNNIGYFVPKYLAPADLGKVLTVVSDDGYRCEWKDPTGGVPQVTPMDLQTYYASGNDYINLEDNVAYFIETHAGGSFVIHLGTLSRQTIHSKIYLVGTQSNCVTMTVVYEDEAGQVCQLNYTYGDSQSDTYYGLDVYARLVTIGGGGGLSYDTTMARVYDYPCQNRDYFSSDNNNIGLVVDYVEPL